MLRPRAVVVLTGFVAAPSGATEPNLTAAVVPLKVAITHRPHSQADTGEVELRGASLPFDPRAVEALGVKVYLANAAREGEDIQRAEHLRFLGTVDLFENEQDDKADVVSLKARDLSGALRDTKPLPAALAPRYSDTLRAAITRITDGVLGAGVVEVVGEDAPLSGLVAGRSATSPVRLPNDASAWGVVEYLCSLCGLLVQVRLDRVEVLQARAAYDHTGEPRAALVFNAADANVLRLKSGKKFLRNRRGVKVVSFDPATRRRVEAVYPPDGELPARRQATPARGRRRASPTPPERDVFVVEAVTQEAQLRRVAESIWLERSRQEAEVEAETPMFTEPFLGLTNGDRVRLQLNRALAAGLNLQQPRAEQVRWVQRRLGVEAPAAALLVDSALRPGADVFYVHIADLRWEAEGLSSVKLELINIFGVTV